MGCLWAPLWFVCLLCVLPVYAPAVVAAALLHAHLAHAVENLWDSPILNAS